MSEQTQVQENKGNPLTEIVIGSFTRAEVATLQNTIAAGTTKEQFNLFLQTCVNSGLNPFLNHIHAVTYNSAKHGMQLSIQVAVEGIAYLARKKENFGGYDVQTVHENDSFKIGKVNGHLQVVEHEISFPRGQIIGAYAIVYKAGSPDFLSIMERSEWEHLKQGRNGENWKKYEADFAKKTVLKRALKAQFGIEINDEQAIGTSEEPAAPVRKEVSQEPEKIIQTGEDEAQDMQALIASKRAEIWNLQESKGMSNEDFETFVQERFEKKPADLNLQQLTGLYKLLLAYTPPAPVQEEEAPAEEPKQEKKSAMDDAFDLFTASN